MVRKLWAIYFEILFYVISTTVAQTLNRCFPYFTDDRIAFDLTPVDVTNNYQDYNISVTPFTENGTLVSDAKVVFKMCGAVDPVPSICTKIPETTAYYLSNNTCVPMNVLLSEMQKSLNKDSTDSITGVTLYYSNENLDLDTRKQLKYQVKFVFTCDKSITNNFKWNAKFEPGFIVLSSAGRMGCQYGISDLLDMFSNNKYIFFPIFILLGGVLTFFGRHTYKWTLLFVGFILGILAVAGICYALGQFVGASDQKRYMIFGGAVLLGIIIGYLMFRYEEQTTSIVVAALALIVCKAVLTLFFPQISMNGYVTMLLLLICGGIGGVVANNWKNPSLIFSTSFGGCFMALLCLGYITTLLDPPGIIQQKAKNGEAPTAAYVFGLLWIILSVLGLVYQCKQLSKEEEIKEHLNDKGKNDQSNISEEKKPEEKKSESKNDKTDPLLDDCRL